MRKTEGGGEREREGEGGWKGEERAARREEGTEAKGGERRRKEGRETPVRWRVSLPY